MYIQNTDCENANPRSKMICLHMSGLPTWPPCAALPTSWSSLLAGFLKEFQSKYNPDIVLFHIMSLPTRPQMVKRSWVKPGAVVIDCGNLSRSSADLISREKHTLTFLLNCSFEAWQLPNGTSSGINSIPDSTKKSGQRLVGDVDYDDVSSLLQ